MTTQGFITAEEIKEGKKGFDVFSVVSILASYAPELAEKIRTGIRELPLNLKQNQGNT